MYFSATREIDKLLNAAPSGYKAPNDEFFKEANNNFIDCYKKLGVITDFEAEFDEEKECSVKNNEIFCNVPGCFQVFRDTSTYQTHYNSIHRYICSVCKKSLPTNFLLDLHITENHDSFFQARLERGEIIYGCYLESCLEKFSNPQERKEHCIAVHKFPPNFRFDRLNSGLKRCKENQKPGIDSNCVGDAAPTKMKDFTFGHTKERSFNCKKIRDTSTSLALSNMDSLKMALEDDEVEMQN